MRTVTVAVVLAALAGCASSSSSSSVPPAGAEDASGTRAPDGATTAPCEPGGACMMEDGRACAPSAACVLCYASTWIRSAPCACASGRWACSHYDCGGAVRAGQLDDLYGDPQCTTQLALSDAGGD